MSVDLTAVRLGAEHDSEVDDGRGDRNVGDIGKPEKIEAVDRDALRNAPKRIWFFSFIARRLVKKVVRVVGWTR
jgi:hypothetical protein